MTPHDYYLDMCIRMQAQVDELAEKLIERNAEIKRLQQALERGGYCTAPEDDDPI